MNKQNIQYWDSRIPYWAFETNNRSVWGTKIFD
jgi:hypothetical protein